MDKSQRHRLRERIVELEAQLRIANDRFEAHTKHVSAFLSEMYAVMIDPLDSSGLKVAEMTATLLDAAKRDRETANMHADALGTLQSLLATAKETIARQDSWGDEAQTTIDTLTKELGTAESLVRDADAELRKYLSMNEGETIIGGIRNLAQAYYSHRDNAETLESLVRDLAQALEKIGLYAGSGKPINGDAIASEAKAALSRILKEMLPE